MGGTGSNNNNSQPKINTSQGQEEVKNNNLSMSSIHNLSKHSFEELEKTEEKQKLVSPKDTNKPQAIE